MNIMSQSTLKTAAIALGAVALAMRINPDVANFLMNTGNDYFLD